VVGIFSRVCFQTFLNNPRRLAHAPAVEGLRAWKKDQRSRQSREYFLAQIDPWRLATQVGMDTGGKAENKDGIHV
jgi:hypothetical protein